jgi:hypothetical protein
MFWDIFISIGLLAVACAMAWIGVHVSLYPPNSETEKRHRKILFLVLGAVAIALTVAQGIRNGITQQELIRTISQNKPQVNVTVPAPTVIQEPPLAPQKATGPSDQHPTITLVDSSSVTLNTKGSPVTNARLTLTHTTTVRKLNLVGLAPGAYVTVVLTQDYIGGATIILGSGCTWYVRTPSGYLQSGRPSLTTAPNGVNILAIWYDGTNCYASLA